VLLRPASDYITTSDGLEIGRKWDVDNLSALCADAQFLDDVGRRYGVRVHCGTFDAQTPLVDVATTLGTARGLIAAHGAGLSNSVFLPRRAKVFELDSVFHAESNRPFYGHLALAAGLRYEKVWLDGTGSRRYPERVFNCTMFDRRGDHIAGNSPVDLREARILEYASPARISHETFRQLVFQAVTPIYL